MPVRTEICTLCPVRNAPSDTETIFPTITAHEKHQHDRPVGRNLRGVDQHADGHERRSRRRCRGPVEPNARRFFNARFGDECPGEKRAERDRVTEVAAKQRETERQPHAGDDGGFRPVKPNDGSHQVAAR